MCGMPKLTSPTKHHRGFSKHCAFLIDKNNWTRWLFIEEQPDAFILFENGIRRNVSLSPQE